MNNIIVIIEDEQDMANFMRDVLVQEGFQVFVENKGLSGLEVVQTVEPEVVLLDLNLPDLDGRSICEKIKQSQSETQVIMITAESTPHDIAQGLNLGADDYIPKPVNPEVLLARVKARLRSTGKTNTTLKIADLELNMQTHQVLRATEEITLSAQEFKLLEYFMSNPNKVLSREMILSRIWNSSPDIETRVVDVYVGYLRKKIDFTKPKLFKSVRGFGYMLQSPAEVAEAPVN
jgi:two-component system OmpR family response regulator